MDSGKWIRELWEKQSVKSPDIERISRSIADSKGNADFYVSHSTLADIETGSVPSIHKLFSLAACLKVSLEELLLVFGIDVNEVRQYGSQVEPGLPRLQTSEFGEPGFREPGSREPGFRQPCANDSIPKDAGMPWWALKTTRWAS